VPVRSRSGEEAKFRAALVSRRLSSLSTAALCSGRTSSRNSSNIEVEKTVRAAVEDVDVVDYGATLGDGFPLPTGLSLVDVTGLAKPIIFDAIRKLLRRDGIVAVAHTGAALHYPLNDDIAAVLDARERATPTRSSPL
jgi:hypothetical protein